MTDDPKSIDPKALGPGRLLGGRFEVHGVVGRGGTATVVLATDRLRGERVALKLVHPHLASDPSTRRRLRREVQTASILRSEAALVPHDLHEFDGVLALSMPFHPGQTLAERVATSGPLPADEVAALATRLASALADAHRAGVLHRDVTPNNVLIADKASSAVLTDFGLARLVLGGTRSTGLLGTTGYAAPEIYEGNRADPRSDLYGLGAVLYLAATGKPAFDTKTPMAALKQQLDGSFQRVSSLAPSLPPDLAALIEQLLSPQPDNRLATARDVQDALAHPSPPPKSAEVAGHSPPERIAGRFLPEGSYTVVIKERTDDRERRNRWRSEQAQPRNLQEELARWGWHIADRVRDALGVPQAPVLTPEERLLVALADEMQVPVESLAPSPVLRRPTFRLVDATDAPTAEVLVTAATDAGFHAEVADLNDPYEQMRRMWLVYIAVMVIGWSTLPLQLEMFGNAALWVLIGISAGWPTLSKALTASSPRMDKRQLERLAIAYRADLVGGVRPDTVLAPRFPAPRRDAQRASERQAVTSPIPHDPALRAEAALDRLDEGIAAADLPDPAKRDLANTSRELRASARALGQEVSRLAAELGRDAGADEQLAVLSARLDRLETLARAGEAANTSEREHLVRAIARHEESLRAADKIESEWVASTARLFEIASTAAQIRREILLERESVPADVLVERLTREARSANDARREAARISARQRHE